MRTDSSSDSSKIIKSKEVDEGKSVVKEGDADLNADNDEKLLTGE